MTFVKHLETQRAPAVPWSAWYLLGVLFLGAVLSYTDRFILSVLIGGIKSDLRLSDTQISLVQGAAFAIVYAFMSLIAGRLADRARRKRIIAIGIVVWTFGTVACALASSLSTLFPSRMIVGIGEALFFPAAVSMLSDVFPPERRGFAVGTLLMGASVGSGVAIYAGGLLLSVLPPQVQLPVLMPLSAWRCVLLLLSAVGVVVAMLVQSLREPPRLHMGGDTANRVVDHSDRFRLRGRPLWLLIALMTIAIADAGTSAWAPSYFTRHYHFSAQDIGARLGVTVMIAGGLGQLFGGLLADITARRLRVDQLWVSVVAGLLTLPCLLFCVTSSPTLALFLYGALVFFIAVANIAGTVTILNSVPARHHGATVAMLAFALILSGLAAGPTLVAALNDYFFQNEASIGRSILAVSAIGMAPSIIIFLALVLRHAPVRKSRPGGEPETSAVG